MRRLSNAFKNRVSSVKSDTSVLSNGGEFPTPADLFRYRKQRGVNLGSWFVLERWITDTPFQQAKAPAQSDLDIALGQNAKQVLEQHWDTWITEKDFEWIAERGLNSVRLPIGYYHLSGADPSVLEGTDFAGLDDVFHGAWQRITNAIVVANTYGLGVLIDLHAAPGKQNGDSHGGTSGEPHFYEKNNMAHTTHVLTTLASHLTEFCASHDPPLLNVLGIEVLNEPIQNGALEKWYLSTIHAIRHVDPIPVYISDCWMPDQWARYIHSHEDIPFTVLDHHLYRCFTSNDGNTPVTQHVKNLTEAGSDTPQTLARVTQKLEEAGSGLIVGEWSGALNPNSLAGAKNEVASRKEFVRAQLALYEKYCAGYFFWTYKKEKPGDKGWSLRDAVECGIFPNRVGLEASVLPNPSPEMQARKDKARETAVEEHSKYWSQYPGKPDSTRFKDGFCQGWDDAWMFFRSVSSLPKQCTVPELGFRGPWVKARAHEYGKENKKTHLWEFEHGFAQGLLAAQRELP